MYVCNKPSDLAMIKKVSRKLVYLLFIIFSSAMLTLSSCDEEDLLGCNRCPDDAPYSPADGGSCYDSRSDCESQEGDDCIICTG